MKSWKTPVQLACELFKLSGRATGGGTAAAASETKTVKPDCKELSSQLRPLRMSSADDDIIKSRKDLKLSKNLKRCLGSSERRKSNERRLLLALVESAMLKHGFPLGCDNWTDVRKDEALLDEFNLGLNDVYNWLAAKSLIGSLSKAQKKKKK